MILRNRFWIRSLTLCTLFAIGLFATLSIAQSYDPEQDIPKPTLLEKRVNKLGRGLSNILFGWTEIPVTWNNKMKEGRPLTYLLSTAPVIGIVRAGVRTGVGVYETFTFVTTKDRANYGPILEPDYIF